MRTRIPCLALAAVLLGGGAVHAQQFEALAERAVHVEDGDGLVALFWASTATCSGITDDLARRQCEGVRAARAASIAGRPVIMAGGPAALVLGGWEKAKAAVSVSVRGCLACAAPLDIAGQRRFVVTRGPLAVVGGALQGPSLGAGAVPVPAAEAKKWLDEVAGRLQVELLFTVPAQPVEWEQGGARGLAVDLVGYRLADPCTGQVLLSQPASAPLAADKSRCPAQPEPVVVKTPDVPPPPKEPALPSVLTPGQIASSLSKARVEVNACYATYGVPGTAKLTIEIGGDGVVMNVSQSGDFEETPTGDCIVRAIKAVQFPRFTSPSMTLRDYPFILR